MTPLTLAALNAIDAEYEISRSEIETLWSLGHYDGPGSGIVRWKRDGKLYLAECRDLFVRYDSGRRFWLVAVPEETMSALVAWCEERARHYGNGMAWTPDGRHDESRPRWGDFGNNHMSREFSRLSAAWNAASPQPKVDVYELPIVGYFDGWRNYGEER